MQSTGFGQWVYHTCGIQRRTCNCMRTDLGGFLRLFKLFEERREKYYS